MSNKYAVLFVCLGNICRSPAMEAYVRYLLKEKKCSDSFYLDSAAITGYHCGQPTDRRMVLAAKKRGITISHKARLVEPSDFTTFDLIVPATHDIAYHLEEMRPPESGAEVILPLGKDITDPYYDDDFQFDRTLDQIETASQWCLEYMLEKISKDG